MSNSRKRTATYIKQAPNNIPFYYSHPQYGYMPPPVYNQSYTHPAPVYPSSDYIFYPINEYGQIVGPPTEFPPIFNQYYPESQLHFGRMSNISNRGSSIHPQRRDRMAYDDYHSHPNSHRSYEKSRRETLPPINKHPFSSTRLVSPDDDEYEQLDVHDLTERVSVTSRLSNRNAIQSIQHYDKLRKSYR